MNQSAVTPEERFAGIVETLIRDADVTFGSPRGKGFGSSALKIDNKIFAMLYQGKLVVKLPAQRVDALVTSGDGEHFGSGPGRLMKEWLALKPTSEVEWLSLAREAMTFVASNQR